MSYAKRHQGHGRRPRNATLSGIEEIRDAQIRMERMIRELLRRSGIELEMEFEQMADFTALNAKVSKMTDLAASFKTMSDGLRAERDAARAELDALKAADAADQDAVNAAEAKLAEVTAVLEAITAMASNTPVDTGGSTGGVVG